MIKYIDNCDYTLRNPEDILEITRVAILEDFVSIIKEKLNETEPIEGYPDAYAELVGDSVENFNVISHNCAEVIIIQIDRP